MVLLNAGVKIEGPLWLDMKEAWESQVGTHSIQNVSCKPSLVSLPLCSTCLMYDLLHRRTT